MSDIDNLEIKINSSTDGAEKGIDALVNSLSKLDQQLGGMGNVKAFTNMISSMSQGVSNLDKSFGALNSGNINKVSSGFTEISLSARNTANMLAKEFDVKSRRGINELSEAIADLYKSVGNSANMEQAKGKIADLIAEYSQYGVEVDRIQKQIREYVSKGGGVPISEGDRAEFGNDWAQMAKVIHNITEASGQDAQSYLEGLNQALGNVITEANTTQDAIRNLYEALKSGSEIKGGAFESDIANIAQLRGRIDDVTKEIEGAANLPRALQNISDGVRELITTVKSLKGSFKSTFTDMSGATKPVQQELEDYFSWIEKAKTYSKDITKGFKPTGDVEALRSQLDGLKEEYYALYNAQAKARVADYSVIDTAEYRQGQVELIALVEKMNTLQAKIKELQQTASEDKVEGVVDAKPFTQALETIEKDITKSAPYFNDLKKYYTSTVNEINKGVEDRSLSRTGVGMTIKALEQNVEILREKYPMAESMINGYDTLIKKLQGFMSATTGGDAKTSVGVKAAIALAEIKQEVQETANAIANVQIPSDIGNVDKYTEKFREAVSEMQRLETETEQLKQKLSDMGGAPSKDKPAVKASEGVAALNLQEEINKNESAIQKYKAQIAELQESGKALNQKWQKDNFKIVPQVDDTSFNANMQRMINKLNEYKKLVKGMESGKIAFNEEQYTQAKQGIAQITSALKEYDATTKQTTSDTSALVSVMQMLANGGGKVLKWFGSGLLNSVSKPLKSISAQMSTMHSKMARLGKTFNRMLVRRFLYAIIKAFKSAIDSLTQFTGAIGQEFNKSMSLLTADFKWVSGNIIAAFAPILNTVIPIIDKLISKLVEAITWINKFVSSLLGKSSYVVAKKQVNDYAASLDTASKKAKKLKDYTLGIDELNIFNEDDDSGSGSGASADDSGYAWEEMPLDFEWDWDSLKEKAEELGRYLADCLNDIFSNMELARKIGETIAELLNVALHFVYGFVDELNWHQMGKWLGELIMAGLTTFEWDLLGKTIGITLNGIADAIIGFFENYKVGTLGESLATMFNNAIETIDPVKIGEAIGDVLGAPLRELISFVKEADIEQAGEKFTTLLKTILTKPLFGEESTTLGYLVGAGLASILNAGIDFLLDADIIGAVSAVATFIGDIFKGAIENVKWVDLATLITELVMDVIFAPFVALFDGLAGIIEPFNKEIADNLRNASKETQDMVNSFNEKLEETVDIYKQEKEATEEWRNSMNEAAEAHKHLTDAIDNVNNGVQYSYSGLMVLQAAYGLTDAQVDVLIHSMEDYNDSLGNGMVATTDASDKLAEYAGSWAELKETMGDSVEAVKEEMDGFATSTETANGRIATSFESSTTTIKTSAETTGNYIDITKSSIDSANAKVPEYLDSMGSVSTTAGNTQTAVSNMNVDITSTLDSLNATMQEWYDNMILTYFSYDGWTTIFAEGILLPLEEFFLSWNEFWNENLLLWWDESIVPYFTEEQWLTLADGMRLGIENKWTQFTKEWKVNFKKWWDIEVVPYFSLKQWTEFGENMRIGLITGWEAFHADWLASFDVFKQEVHGGLQAILTDITGMFNGMVDVLNEAMSGVESSMNDLIDDYNAVADIIGGPTVPNVSYSPAPRVTIPAFANGGYPEIGSLFFAGEAGAELVGSIDGKTGVASNEEITGIREAVAASGNETAQLLGQIISIAAELLDKEPVILGDRDIAEASNRGQNLLGYAIIS